MFNNQSHAFHIPLPDRFTSLQRLIGNTPLLEVHFTLRGRSRTIYAKLESQNLTGSIKDRMALHILKRAYQQERIKPGDMIVEATSGNTGISFCAIGRALGHRVTIFMPNWMSQERKLLIESMGAEIVPVTPEQDGFLGCIRMTEELVQREAGVFLPRQFTNQENVEAHQMTTGPEIWAQLQSRSLVPSTFVSGIGTGGTIMGVGRYLRGKNPRLRIHPLEPMESPTLSKGLKTGHHRIQGICDQFVPDIVKLDELDSVVPIHDGDAIIMAQKLASQIGLGVGISSGANFLAALKVLDELDEQSVVVTVFPDDNKKYLSTDLLRVEPSADHYLSPKVELLYYNATGRVCSACDAVEKRKAA
ncbi:MAG TPA: cysteine synthase family protein [Thermoguttaceae bacterium]